MNNKLLELIDPKTQSDPWLDALETQVKNITLSGGVVWGVVSNKKEQSMTGCEGVDVVELYKIREPMVWRPDWKIGATRAREGIDITR